MAAAILLLVILAGIAMLLCAADNTQEPKIQIKLGSKKNSEMIYENILSQSARFLSKREDILNIHSANTSVISAIFIELLEGKGNSFIYKGGIGERKVSILLKSELGNGYKFRVRVFSKERFMVDLEKAIEHGKMVIGLLK